MASRILWAALVSLTLGCTLGGGYRATAPPEAVTAADKARWDAKATALVERMIAAVGGLEAWQRIGEVQFTMGLESSGRRLASAKHAWDRATARHRFEYEAIAVRPYLVAHRIDGAATGKAYPLVARGHRNKEPLSGAEYVELARQALDHFRRDVFLLVLPFRLHVRGANLAHRGAQVAPDGKSYEVLEVWFTGADWLPSDRYQVFVDPASNLPAWVAKSGADAAEAYRPEEWTEKAGIRVPRSWTSPTGMRVVFDNIALAPEAVEDEIYMPWLGSKGKFQAR